jgi:hypothetical protein
MAPSMHKVIPHRAEGFGLTINLRVSLMTITPASRRNNLIGQFNRVKGFRNQTYNSLSQTLIESIHQVYPDFSR